MISVHELITRSGWRLHTPGSHRRYFRWIEIDADDSWAILAAFERCAIVTWQINYLFRPLRRDCVVVTTEHSFHVLDFR